MNRDVTPWLEQQVRRHPYPLMFATISGAHLYGFPSPDSDYDLRGAHLLPLPEVVGLEVRGETVEKSAIEEGLEIDLVTHDIRKYFDMVLRRNGSVLEQIFSPLVVHTTPAHGNSRRSPRHASRAITPTTTWDSQRRSGNCFRRKILPE
jgi:predicted nucleotidyltransferase